MKQEVKSEESDVGPVVVGITCITEMKEELDDVADVGGGSGVVDMADITPPGAATAPWRVMQLQPQTPPKANS